MNTDKFDDLVLIYRDELAVAADGLVRRGYDMGGTSAEIMQAMLSVLITMAAGLAAQGMTEKQFSSGCRQAFLIINPPGKVVN